MESTPSRYYRLHDVSICARADRADLLRALDATLRYKGAVDATAPSPSDLTLDFASTASRAAVPDDATWLGQSEHGNVTVWRSADRMYLSHDDAVVALDPAGGRAAAALPPSLTTFSERRRDPLFYLITFSLVILLRYQRWYPLHAAALVRDGRGLLLVAASDSGKSTAALNLVRAGWNYLSDDAVLLRAGEKAVRAYAFRRHFCVDPDATALFPELAAHEWPASLSDPTKWQVDAQRLYPGQFVPTCTPHAIVLPTIASADTSTLTSVSAKVVLGHLINQGELFMTPTPDVVSRHLDVFRRLISQSSLRRLEAGRDLLDDPAQTSRMLAPLLNPTSAA